jgi:hypothetical protein
VISLPFRLLDEREPNVYGDVIDEHDACYGGSLSTCHTPVDVPRGYTSDLKPYPSDRLNWCRAIEVV